MNRLGALEALGRGLANVRANRQVVLASAAGSLLLVALTVLSLMPWITALGLDAGRLFTGQGAGLQDLAGLAGAALSPSELIARLGAGLLAFLLGLTLASVVYSWYYAGLLGVLAAGDAQAPAGPGREPAVFRTWSWRFFVYEASRLTWRVLIYLSVVLGLALLVVLLAGALLMAIAWIATRRSGGAAVAVGCGGMLPLLFALLTIVGAGWLGLGELARPEGSVRSALRLGFQVFGRRLGACLALIALLFVVSLAVALLFGGLNLFLAVAGLSTGARLAADLALMLVQLVVNSALSMTFLAACIALLRAEAAGAHEAQPG